MNSSTMELIESSIEDTKNKLMEDLRLVVENAEELLHSTADQSGEAAIAARARIQESLKSVRKNLLSAEKSIISRTREAAKSTDEYVHDNPWKSIGIGACVGVIVGLLIAKR